MTRKEKHREYMREFYRKRFKREPWFMHRHSAQGRCNNRKRNWFKRGIKMLLTVEEVKCLWFRDKAYLLSKPSLDRINNNGHYEFLNCRFIEQSENSRLGNIGNTIKRGRYQKKVGPNSLVMRKRREKKYRSEI